MLIYPCNIGRAGRPAGTSVKRETVAVECLPALAEMKFMTLFALVVGPLRPIRQNHPMLMFGNGAAGAHEIA